MDGKAVVAISGRGGLPTAEMLKKVIESGEAGLAPIIVGDKITSVDLVRISKENKDETSD